MNIPKSAELVFSGKKFNVYQWNQLMFDGTFQVFEGIKRKNIVQIIPYDREKIYLLYEEQPGKEPYYSLIGGELEDNEDNIAGVVRELKEETGFITEKVKLLKKFTPCSLIEWDIFIYTTTDFKKNNFKNLDIGEKNKIIETSIEGFIDIVLSENFSGKEFANYLYKIKTEFGIEKLKNILLSN